MSTVSLIQCDDYDPGKVLEACEGAIEALGGIGSIITPGDRVLLKVNLLLGTPPERMVTTHPSVVRAMAEIVLRAGGKPMIGDSSGAVGLTARAMRVAGFIKVAVETGAEIANFESAGTYKIDMPAGSILEAVHIAKPVLDCDVLINLPKLKTHRVTRMTGAIKNLYGAIPGGGKPAIHMRAPGEERFSEALVDVFEAASRKLKLTVIDAVVGMEGEGPTNGRPIRSRAILAGRDAVALDAVAARFMGFDDPATICPTRIAHRRGLGEIDLNRIEVIGEDLEHCRIDFRKFIITRHLFTNLPGFLNTYLYRQLHDYTSIVFDKEACAKCGSCRDACPAEAITLDPTPVIDKKSCIKCYCCHELCAHNAVKLKMSLGGKILSKVLMPGMLGD